MAVPASQAPEQVRGHDGPADLNAWRRFGSDLDLVQAVDSILKGMDSSGEDVDMFLDALPRWYAGVAFATTPWGTNVGAPRPACSDGDLNLLKALGLVIRSGKPVSIGEDDQRRLVDVLAQARSLVEEESDGFSDDVRRYLHSLIVRAEMVARNVEQFGPEAVRQVAFELGGAMTTEAEKLERADEPEKAKRWKSAATLLMGGFLGALGSEAAELAAGGGADAVRAIAGG